MTFRNPVRRVGAPGVAGEREALTAWLAWHRATLLTKLDGLADEPLRRAVLPTGLSLLGIVRHLAQVEQGWFALGFAGIDEPVVFGESDDEDESFRVGPEETTDEIVGTYLRMCERSREIVAAAESLDIAVPDERRGKVDLRWILIHMIEETARHNGHADVIRELVDGTVGD
ncbi:DinB family protein [Amycolatopsis australiensis]|uniref:Uncharacterized damage-inducible protein DinB (Forms a four-helix bundle) n=1 Tax=Amycolatopsis australiensis TaxID=546364 RepID=A0A1K1RL71_9PSEU|nr:DinB family protein [Amycolatopsis australiensis]SFW73011.1 Uncharacterized damage-inducible protein DinB (forms a four-helix bundle) [Amycolatopsis australiensis]